jgi:hypothetical protein
MRALAWNGAMLYASRRYELWCALMEDPYRALSWQKVGEFRPSWKRRFTVRNRLTARLVRDGFHALSVLPSGDIVAVVRGAIVTLAPNQTEFRQSFAIRRGTRPLHITAVPGGTVFWGEYFDNRSRDEVHIYASNDGGLNWQIAYTFPKGGVRHIHNIVHDSFQNCLWVLTGDDGDECRILRASYDFSAVDVVLKGNQQARAVAAVPTEDGLYFASDTPFEQNFIYHLNRDGKVSRLAPISGSAIYGCRVRGRLFFSTMVEPSQVNRDTTVRLYGANPRRPQQWQNVLNWRKDRWPMKFFQYGNAFLPDGNNSTACLAVSTIAVESDDMATSLYSVKPDALP